MKIIITITNKIKEFIFNLLFKDYIDNKLKDSEIKLKYYQDNCKSIQNNIINILNHFDISIDINPNPKYSKSWAVISIQGKNEDFIQFIDDVSDKDIREISEFLRRFNRYKIDCPIGMKEMFRIDKNDRLED